VKETSTVPCQSYPCQSCPLALPDRRQAALALLRAMPEGTRLSADDLAAAFGLPLEALQKRLDEYRTECDNWIEARRPGTEESRFLYRIGAVASIVRDMLAGSGASGDFCRP
jgi:hypothetical protein